MINIEHKLSELNSLAMKKEIIRSKDHQNRKVSVEQLKEMFKAEGENYTDEDVEKIWNFFYLLIHIEMEVIKGIYREFEKETEDEENSSEQDEYKMAS